MIYFISSVLFDFLLIFLPEKDFPFSQMYNFPYNTEFVILIELESRV